MRKRRDVVGWPLAEGTDERIACSYCDCLQDKKPIAEGTVALCANCGRMLYQNGSNSLQGAISFSLAALVFWAISLIFPFLTISELGLSNSMNLIEAMQSLWSEGGQAMALGIGIFAVLMPLLLTSSLLYVAIPLLFGRSLPGVILVFRAVLFFQAWTMVEVFFVGAIISLIKLTRLAEIGFGPGFWESLVMLV